MTDEQVETYMMLQETILIYEKAIDQLQRIRWELYHQLGVVLGQEVRGSSRYSPEDKRRVEMQLMETYGE